LKYETVENEAQDVKATLKVVDRTPKFEVEDRIEGRASNLSIQEDQLPQFAQQQLRQGYFSHEHQASAEMEDAVALLQRMRQQKCADEQNMSQAEEEEELDADKVALVQDMMEEHFGDFKPEFLLQDILPEVPDLVYLPDSPEQDKAEKIPEKAEEEEEYFSGGE
jgi:hypothetical protein